MEIPTSRSPSPVKRNYEEDLRGLFSNEQSASMTYSPLRNMEKCRETRLSDAEDEIRTLKKRLVDQELTFESEKFKLVREFTIKLREEERYRVDLLSKVAELEGVKLTLEKELFEGLSSGSFRSTALPLIQELKDKVAQVTDENCSLRAELQHRASVPRESEGKFEAERARANLRLMERELRVKEEETAKLQKTVSSLQLDSRFLREELSKQEANLNDLRRDFTCVERENASLRQETQRLNTENNRLVLRLQENSDLVTEVRPKDYLALQQRLEDTTQRIQSLEQHITQTTDTYGDRYSRPTLRNRSVRRTQRDKRPKSRASARNGSLEHRRGRK